MSTMNIVKRYIDSRDVACKMHKIGMILTPAGAIQNAGISADRFVTGVVAKDRYGLVMVVVTAEKSVDFEALSKLMGRRLEVAAPENIHAVFKNTDSALIPPLGEPFGIRTIIDDSLAEVTTVYFPAGDNATLIEVTSKDFFRLQTSAWLAHDFTTAVPTVKQETKIYEESRQEQTITDPAVKLREKLERLQNLPPMPEMAQKIIELAGNATATADDLADIIQLDPSLAAQVMRYASSPLFNYRGKVESVRTAVSRVLGYDMVLNLALGLAIARPFKVQRTGPFGLDAFWRHAAYSASLTQALSTALPAQQRPKPGLAFLAGLLHNFGHLLMGHLCKQEFAYLNLLAAERPDISAEELELRTLGVTHAELGSWLMTAWRLPEEIIVATREHHNLQYQGPHAIYSQLVMLADHILKSHGMGDAASSHLPTEVLEKLHLNEVQILMVLNKVLEGCEGLNVMAQQLAA